MKINGTITTLKERIQKKNINLNGIKLNLECDVSLDKIIFNITSINIDSKSYIPYYFNLVSSCHDSYSWFNDWRNKDFPEFKINESFSISTPPQIIKHLNTFNALDNYNCNKFDKKQNQKLSVAKDLLLADIRSNIHANLGFGWLNSNTLIELIGKSRYSELENAVSKYFDEIQRWINDKNEKTKKEKELQDIKNNKIRQAAIKLLLDNGFNNKNISVIKDEILIEQAKDIAINNWKIENPDFDCSEKHYDDNGRYHYYLNCYFEDSKGKFIVYPQKEHY